MKKDIGNKAETKKTAAKKVAKVPPTAAKGIPRREVLPPLPPPPGPPPSSSSRPTEDTMPDWVESWGQEVNEQVDKDLQEMLGAVSGAKGKTEAGGKGKAEAGGKSKQRTGWLNKCAALCQAYMDGEWDKCYQLVQK